MHCYCLLLFYAALQYYVDADYCYRRSSVISLSICLSVTTVSPAKTAEPIEMSFGLWTQVGPGSICISLCVHTGATWRIRLNNTSACGGGEGAFFVNYFDHFVFHSVVG